MELGKFDHFLKIFFKKNLHSQSLMVSTLKHKLPQLRDFVRTIYSVPKRGISPVIQSRIRFPDLCTKWDEFDVLKAWKSASMLERTNYGKTTVPIISGANSHQLPLLQTFFGKLNLKFRDYCGSGRMYDLRH